jgi:hypothetical protein
MDKQLIKRYCVVCGTSHNETINMLDIPCLDIVGIGWTDNYTPKIS